MRNKVSVSKHTVLDLVKALNYSTVINVRKSDVDGCFFKSTDTYSGIKFVGVYKAKKMGFTDFISRYITAELIELRVYANADAENPIATYTKEYKFNSDSDVSWKNIFVKNPVRFKGSKTIRDITTSVLPHVQLG